MSALKQLTVEMEHALAHCGRNIRDIELVVASKYFSIEQILDLYHQGVKTFGENKVQDALLKIVSLPKDISWHFIGHLQKNKVSKIVGLFDLIHSVDSYELALKISEKSTKKQSILLQINLSEEDSKSGFHKQEFCAILPQIEALNNIEVVGLMTMAPKTEDLNLSQKIFSQLFELRKELLKPHWKLSMGMSQDFVPAIECGANYIRVGRRLLSGQT